MHGNQGRREQDVMAVHIFIFFFSSFLVSTLHYTTNRYGLLEFVSCIFLFFASIDITSCLNPIVVPMATPMYFCLGRCAKSGRRSSPSGQILGSQTSRATARVGPQSVSDGPWSKCVTALVRETYWQQSHEARCHRMSFFLPCLHIALDCQLSNCVYL